MTRSLFGVLPLVLGVAGVFAAPTEARSAYRGGYSMEILIDGIPLAEHVARGTTYVEAREGRDYAVRLRNHTGERIAVALAVDGLNSIDAKRTAARDGAKWILEPYRTVTIRGWQTSSSTARRFFFTTERESYGAWLGKTRDLGVISAAVFRERRPWPEPPCCDDDEFSKSAPRSDAPLAGESRSEAEAAPSGKREREATVRQKADLSDRMAATGIGRETGHRVRRVAFDAEDDPAAVLTVRYEYRDALVRLGVLRDGWDDRLSRRERATGFEDMDFAPDPHR